MKPYINKQSCPVPDCFAKFVGYNKPELSKHRKRQNTNTVCPVILSVHCLSYCSTLFSLCFWPMRSGTIKKKRSRKTCNYVVFWIMLNIKLYKIKLWNRTICLLQLSKSLSVNTFLIPKELSAVCLIALLISCNKNIFMNLFTWMNLYLIILEDCMYAHLHNLENTGSVMIFTHLSDNNLENSWKFCQLRNISKKKVLM